MNANYANNGATGLNAMALGPNATAGGTNGIAIGNGANASSEGATVIGAQSLVSGTNGVALGMGATASAANAVALGANSIADQPNTVSVGAPGTERRITNVAPGINSTDAVNVSQLNALGSAVNDVARKAYAGIAGATALTMIPDVDQNKTLMVGVGTGVYQGYSAFAFGFTARLTNNLKLRGGVSGSSAGYTYGAGLGYQW
ncbi:YadA family autotransporter adhesin [Burkholderia cepacia]|uniref:YadA family autotransporter adhesin n=1 Tax=Burkholderia cepacia TaxID=292 RepID=UPI0022A8554D|nr:YadA-like family protein [Burkholderia cepacia]